jgi:DNA (cytosine-5)-methyltransferase 1
MGMKALELFAGAGGLGMGITLAGFEPTAVVEWDKYACDTIRENQLRGFPLVRDWPLSQSDVREFDLESLPNGIDLVAGGPPCQPFSMGGKHRAYDDSRDMFPAAVETVRRVRPRAFIFENVKGLTRSSFHNYFEYIKLQLEFPEVLRKSGEDWQGHHARLQMEKTSGRLHRAGGLTYNVIATLVNAADYGVPQKRERVFIVGFRNDLGIEWSFPRATHSLEALIADQWVSGQYWERHKVSKRDGQQPPPPIASKISRARDADAILLPWRTVRDALEGLPDPERNKNNELFTSHRFQPGAKAYPGHTGSPLDLPAKTLKAGDHGVPGGENMLVKPNGAVRYFTVRESARLQTFPDGFVFHGSWTETMRQLGNAVPVSLAHVVASNVAQRLIEADMRSAAIRMRKN